MRVASIEYMNYKSESRQLQGIYSPQLNCRYERTFIESICASKQPRILAEQDCLRQNRSNCVKHFAHFESKSHFTLYYQFVFMCVLYFLAIHCFEINFAFVSHAENVS